MKLHSWVKTWFNFRTVSRSKIILLCLCGVIGASVLFFATAKKDLTIQRQPSSRLLCLILTTPAANKTKMAAVNATWAPRCDRTLYVISGNISGNSSGNGFLYVDAPDGRQHLTGKVIEALTYVYTHLIDDFDWILKADDDTYVVVENLKYLISRYDPEQPGYLGRHFKRGPKKGYMSGGAGYVISSSGLRHLVNIGFAGNHCKADGGDEDVEIVFCLHASDVRVLSSLDVHGRESFQPESTSTMILNGPKTKWVEIYSWNDDKNRDRCCSEFIISFHRMSPDDMYVTEHLLYRTTVLRPASITPLQDRNVYKVETVHFNTSGESN